MSAMKHNVGEKWISPLLLILLLKLLVSLY